jgi:hypothetical protein
MTSSLFFRHISADEGSRIRWHWPQHPAFQHEAYNQRYFVLGLLVEVDTM